MLLEPFYAVLFGLMGILSPCAFIIIPVLAAQAEGKLRNIITFLFGLFITFMIIGVLFGLTGKLITVFFGDYIYLIAALFTLLLSLQMFSIINLKLPLLNINHGYKHPFLTGLFFGLIVLCCVGPSLAATLAIIMLNPTISYSLLIMTLYALGFIIPFILLGLIFTNKKVHKSIMLKHNLIKKASASVLLAVSLYLFYILFTGLAS